MVVVLAAMASVGCGDAPTEADATQAEATTNPVIAYTVRGRVTQLPGGTGHPAWEFRVRHEAIPEFKPTFDATGDQLGMTSMNMAFPLGEGVVVDQFDVGDPVEMTFEVTYDAETGRLRGYVVTKLETLPADTPLQIGD